MTRKNVEPKLVQRVYTLLTKKAAPLNDKLPHYKCMIRSSEQTRA